MKPDWDKLAEEFADSQKVVIADVDCSSEVFDQRPFDQGSEQLMSPE